MADNPHHAQSSGLHIGEGGADATVNGFEANDIPTRVIPSQKEQMQKDENLKPVSASVFLFISFDIPSVAHPSADAQKEHGHETGGACVENTLAACREEDFPCKYRPFQMKPVLPLHRQWE